MISELPADRYHKKAEFPEGIFPAAIQKSGNGKSFLLSPNSGNPDSFQVYL
jgi:hypothetical protein